MQTYTHTKLQHLRQLNIQTHKQTTLHTYTNTIIHAHIHTKSTITQNTITNIHNRKHKDTHTIPEYTHTRMQTYKHTIHNHTHMHSYKNAIILACKHTDIQRYTPTRIQEDNTIIQ